MRGKLFERTFLYYLSVDLSSERKSGKLIILWKWEMDLLDYFSYNFGIIKIFLYFYV